MKIEIETNSYNERRYSKPWIAVVTFSGKAEANFEFGEWVGRAGDAGILVIDAEPGAIVARGQKDYRKTRNSTADYYRVEADGSLTDLDGKADAYREFQAARAAAEKAAAEPADERAALLAEREALLARLAEINEALGESAPAAKRQRAAAIAAAQMALFPAAVVGSQMALF